MLIVSVDPPQAEDLVSVTSVAVAKFPAAAFNLFVSAAVPSASYCAQPFLVVALVSSIISPADRLTIAVVADAV